jgi:trimeric autotransporter adhesin
VSGSGRLIAFASVATNLIAGNTVAKGIFLRDTCLGAPAGCVPTTVLLSRLPAGIHADGASEFPAISADGHYVVFQSNASNLGANLSNGHIQVYLAKTGF